MQLTRTHDMELVERLMRHPRVWPHLHDDGTPEDWKPIDHEAIYWMLVTVAGAPLGVFLVHPVNSFCFEMHTCLWPELWGVQAHRAALLLGDWVFSDTVCRKMITNVPAYNRRALRFAKAGGMRQEGINRASFMRRGEMLDQIVLGVTKEEWPPCQQQSQSR